MFRTTYQLNLSSSIRIKYKASHRIYFHFNITLPNTTTHLSTQVFNLQFFIPKMSQVSHCKGCRYWPFTLQFDKVPPHERAPTL